MSESRHCGSIPGMGIELKKCGKPGDDAETVPGLTGRRFLLHGGSGMARDQIDKTNDSIQTGFTEVTKQ